MIGHRHIMRTVSALVLLLVFVGGGVLAPTVHRMHHVAPGHASSRAATDAACDHAQHGVAFEVVPPALHDDPCVLCDRHFTSLAALAGQVAVSLRDAAHVPGADGLLLSTSSSRTTIRGPPPSA